MMSRGRRLLGLLEVVVPVALLIGYAGWSAARGSFYFPPLIDIGERFWEIWVFDRVPTDLLPSLRRLFIGYLLSVILGVGFGLLLGTFRLLQRAVQPVAEFLRALPAVALIPFGILVVGIGDTMKVLIIVLGSVWPILLNTIDGVRGVDSEKLEMARAYDVPRAARMREIVIPATLPRVVTGMRTSMSMAIILMVVSEMVASRNGVGYFVLESQRRFAISDMWAGILLLGIIGYVSNFLFVRAERRMLHWHHASKAAVR